MNYELAPSIIVLGDMRDLHHHGCSAVMHEIEHGLIEVGLYPQLFIAGLNWQGHHDDCLHADLVVINGEGALHHSKPSVEQVLSLAEARRALGKPTALVNSSWFENAPALTARLVAFDHISIRESLSEQQLAIMDIPCNLVPDLAIRYALRFQPDGSSTTSIGFMVSDSTRPKLTLQLRRVARFCNWTYLPALARPLDARPSAKSKKIRRRYLLGRLLGPLANYLLSPRHHAHRVGAPDLASYCDPLSRSCGVLTGRFHTVCLAIGLQIPLVAISSNTPKIESLIADAGLDLARRTINPEQLASFTEVPPYSDEERLALEKFLTQARADYKALFTQLAALVSQRP
jgi:polysaccharide pyruvyl transferase WcaK-like protein